VLENCRANWARRGLAWSPAIWAARPAGETAAGSEGKLGGGVDILVNKQASARTCWRWRMKGEDWEMVLNVIYPARFRLSRAQRGDDGPRWGRIISITSRGGVMGNARTGGLSPASKGVDRQCPNRIAQEMAPRGITVKLASTRNLSATAMIRRAAPTSLKGEDQQKRPLGL